MAGIGRRPQDNRVIGRSGDRKTDKREQEWRCPKEANSTSAKNRRHFCRISLSIPTGQKRACREPLEGGEGDLLALRLLLLLRFLLQALLPALLVLLHELQGLLTLVRSKHGINL